MALWSSSPAPALGQPYASAFAQAGQMRLWTWQSFAHGADAVSYFRWRTAPVGTEFIGMAC
ncbi:MAG: beta-galactosidase [Hydrogeniiclostridium mannosilyticum]